MTTRMGAILPAPSAPATRGLGGRFAHVEGTAGYWIRPMRPEDVPAAERLTAEGFHELELETRVADQPLPALRSPARAELWSRRVRHVLAHDAGGCWVAEGPDGLVGAVVSLRRELLWVLTTYVVRPGLQGRGIGRELLAAALRHGDGCLRGMLAATDDPRAVRRYRLAGFELHPAMTLTGRVDRSALPVVDRVREGSAADIDLMDSVDRQVRQAAHGVDHELLTELHRLLVVDRPTGCGYAYVTAEGPYLLAATNRRTATDLLWEALACTDPSSDVEVRPVTPANQWAVDVGLAARLSVRTRGYLAVRHMKPPAPYLPSVHFL
jgi:GNAT superfamily N-acetyltransferase